MKYEIGSGADLCGAEEKMKFSPVEVRDAVYLPAFTWEGDWLGFGKFLQRKCICCGKEFDDVWVNTHFSDVPPKPEGPVILNKQRGHTSQTGMTDWESLPNRIVKDPKFVRYPKTSNLTPQVPEGCWASYVSNDCYSRHVMYTWLDEDEYKGKDACICIDCLCAVMNDGPELVIEQGHLQIFRIGEPLPDDFSRNTFRSKLSIFNHAVFYSSHPQLSFVVDAIKVMRGDYANADYFYLFSYRRRTDDGEEIEIRSPDHETVSLNLKNGTYLAVHPFPRDDRED